MLSERDKTIIRSSCFYRVCLVGIRVTVALIVASIVVINLGVGSSSPLWSRMVPVIAIFILVAIGMMLVAMVVALRRDRRSGQERERTIIGRMGRYHLMVMLMTDLVRFRRRAPPQTVPAKTVEPDDHSESKV